MSATQVQTARPEKYLVRNNTAGYIGVIEINPRNGDELGVNIEPFGTRWMTEDEMIATARASRDPADNPFEEQSFTMQDSETQQRSEVRVRPLVLDTEARYVPGRSDRYVPTQDSSKDAADAPPVPVAQDIPGPPLRTQRQGGPRPADAPEEGSWVEPPEAPGQVIGGSLGGSDETAPEPERAPEPTNHPGGERYTPPTQGAVKMPGEAAAEEEHAAKVDPAIGEETGAAQPPAQPQPEGEYAQAEEVGSPDAPAATEDNDETLIGG